MSTFVLIEKYTVGAGGASSVTLGSGGTIPQTYTDLKLIMSAKGTYSGGNYEYLTLYFNNSSVNFTNKEIYYYGASTVGSYSGTGGYDATINASGAGVTANTFSNGELYIPNYTSSNYKSYSLDTVTEQNGTTGNQMNMHVHLWSNTAAITSIKFTPQNGNFAQYSTFYLYGILKA